MDVMIFKLRFVVRSLRAVTLYDDECSVNQPYDHVTSMTNLPLFFSTVAGAERILCEMEGMG